MAEPAQSDQIHRLARDCCSLKEITNLPVPIDKDCTLLTARDSTRWE